MELIVNQKIAAFGDIIGPTGWRFSNFSDLFSAVFPQRHRPPDDAFLGGELSRRQSAEQLLRELLGATKVSEAKQSSVAVQKHKCRR